MNSPGKSDRPVVPEKSANGGRVKPPTSLGELAGLLQRMEGRGLAKEKGEGPSERPLPPAEPAKQVDRTQRRVGGGHTSSEDLSSALDRIRQAAQRDKGLKFTSLWHHVYKVDRLRGAYLALKRDAAPGIDGQTWQAYGKELEANLQDLSGRLVRGAYRAKPVKRVYIPKADGRERPIGIPALEDKIVQRATVGVLNAVYETDFLGFSYGFRPGRSAHQALDALAVGIQRKKVNWVLDADIRGFFDSLNHGWLMEFVGHRIADRHVTRHIQKWLNAGVLEDGKRVEQEEGTPQGGSISPLLANIYLFYAFDLWAEQWRKRQAQGDVVIVRYADDFVVGFEHQTDAQRFLMDLRERFRRFGLELHDQKTRIIAFGRHADRRDDKPGGGKPATFNFLGFTHVCGKTRAGRFTVLRRTMAKRMRAKLREVKETLRRRLHDPIGAVGTWLAAVVRGHAGYYGVPRNSEALARFHHLVRHLWQNALKRRSQKNRVTEKRMGELVRRWLPRPRICHPYPEDRLCVNIQGKSPVR